MVDGTTLKGQGQEFGGVVKQDIGRATGDSSLTASGVADQVTGTAKQAVGAARDAIQNPGPLVDKAKGFAKARPFATAALVGVVGMALLNTLRGK